MDRHPDLMPSVLLAMQTRRQFLRRTALTALTLSGAGLLAACGGPPPSQQSKPAAPAATTAPAAPAATSAPAAAAPTSVPAAAKPTDAPKPAEAAKPTEAAKPAAAAPTTAPAASGAPVGKPGGDLIYALATRFDSLDVNVTTFSVVGRMGFHMFDQLVREPSAGKFVPSLAERWEVSPNADEYTFYLRKDVKFHDGTPFNAEAVKYTFDRIVNPEMKSQVALSLIGPYDSSTVVDPYTVKVKFRTGYAPFLDSVAQPFLSIISPTAAEKYGKDFGANPVGTGPYKFESYKTDTEVRMVKNPDYAWAPAIYRHTGQPYLDAITWRIINDPATRVAALKAGEVHMLEDLPLQNYAEFQGNNAFQIVDGVMAGSGYSLMINVTKPPTDDVKVRQAMEWATDKAGIIKATWNGLFQPACSVLTSITFGYDPSTCQAYSYDPKKAGTLLDEAGWKMDGDVRKKNGEELLIKFYYRADQAVNVSQATFIQASWQQVGFKVELNGLAQAGYFDAVRRGDHNMQPWWGPATDPDVVRQYYHSKNADGGTNRNRYKNPEMDKMIDEASAYTDPEKRKQAYAAIQKKVLDEAIMIFIADSKNVFATQKAKVNDVTLDWSATYPLLYDASLNG